MHSRTQLRTYHEKISEKVLDTLEKESYFFGKLEQHVCRIEKCQNCKIPMSNMSISFLLEYPSKTYTDFESSKMVGTIGYVISVTSNLNENSSQAPRRLYLEA